MCSHLIDKLNLSNCIYLVKPLFIQGFLHVNLKLLLEEIGIIILSFQKANLSHRFLLKYFFRPEAEEGWQHSMTTYSTYIVSLDCLKETFLKALQSTSNILILNFQPGQCKRHGLLSLYIKESKPGSYMAKHTG